jgi:hypothetical protein
VRVGNEDKKLSGTKVLPSGSVPVLAFEATVHIEKLHCPGLFRKGRPKQRRVRRSACTSASAGQCYSHHVEHAGRRIFEGRKASVPWSCGIITYSRCHVGERDVGGTKTWRWVALLEIGKCITAMLPWTGPGYRRAVDDAARVGALLTRLSFVDGGGRLEWTVGRCA